MSSVPARGGMTTYLFGQLETGLAAAQPPAGFGDAIAPVDYGWTGGEPGKGVFKPYGVLKTLSANAQRNPQSIGTAQTDLWVFPYQLTSWGALREQADYVADTANQILSGIDVKALRLLDDPPVPDFVVQQIVVGPLGPTDRTDQTAPPLWSRTDSVTVWLARARRA